MDAAQQLHESTAVTRATQPLRYAINTTLDGCCHHEAGLPPDAESMAFWTDELHRSDTLLYGRVTYELMEGAWRRPESGEWPDWMDDSEVAFSEVMDPMRKVVASGTLDAVDWNAELVRGDVVDAVRASRSSRGEVSRSGRKAPRDARRARAHRRVHICGASGRRGARTTAARWHPGSDPARARRAACVPFGRDGAALPARRIGKGPARTGRARPWHPEFSPGGTGSRCIRSRRRRRPWPGSPRSRRRPSASG